MSGQSVELTLGTNNSALKTGLDQARHQVEGFKEQTHEMLMGLFAGVGIEQLLEKFGQIQDKAEAFGTTAEAVQRVDQFAQMAGSSVDDVAKAMAKLRVNSEKLGQLGLDPQEFAGAGMDEQLLMVAESLDKIEDPAQRVNVAIELFGAKLAGKILPLLNGGAEEMKAFFEGATVASNETVAQLDAAGDRLTDLKNKVTVFAADIFGFVDKVMRTIGTGVGAGITLITNGLGRVGEVLQSLMQGDFKGVATAFQANITDLTGNMAETAQSVSDIWSGQGGPEKKKRGRWDPSLEGKGEGDGKDKERLSVAERIKALEEEHALKQLTAGERLKKLAEERAALEQQLSGLKDEDDAKRKQIEDRLVGNTRDRLAAEDELKKLDGKEKLTVAERIKALEEEHALKQLEAHDRLKKLAEERMRLEKELAGLGKDDVEKRKQVEDKLVGNAKERLAAQDELKKNQEKAAEEQRKAREKVDRESDRRTMDWFRDQERQLGFASGVKQVGESGQQLAGVDYSVINSEAERGIKLQEEMRNYMKIIAEKEYKVELPDAS